MSSTSAAEQRVDRFDLVGAVLDGKFRVERVVTEGGFGIVYYGRHMTLERPIAIKVLKTPPELTASAREEFLEKFALEAKTIARINHPSIVQVLDFGASTMPSGVRAPWMVLEWLTGITLEEELEARRAKGGRGPAETLALLRPMFEALAFAHDEGIAHRDIKPANAMLVSNKRGSSLRLLDFGIAKVMEEGDSVRTGQTDTRAALISCSPDYGAPEQISLMRTGPWTDVHALALVVVEVLLDAAPYTGATMGALYSQILSEKRPTPAARGLDVGAWEPVLRKALAIDPNDRHHNAAELLAALEAALPDATKHYNAALAPRLGASGVRRALETQPGADLEFDLELAREGADASGVQPAMVAPEQQARVSSAKPTQVLPAPPKRRPVALAAMGVVVAGALGLVLTLHGPRTGATSPSAARAAAARALVPAAVDPTAALAARDPAMPNTTLDLGTPRAAPAPPAPAPSPAPASRAAPSAPAVAATTGPEPSTTSAGEHAPDAVRAGARRGHESALPSARAHRPRELVPVELE